MKNAFVTPIMERLALGMGLAINVEPRYEYAAK